MKLCYTTHLPAIVGSTVDHLTQLIESGPDAIILRAKMLSTDEYEDLLLALMPIAKKCGVSLIANHQPELAAKYQLPLQIGYGDIYIPKPSTPWGVSVHKEEEAIKAAKLGASWVTYGHIFPTACKPGVPPRGIEALKNITSKIDIPVLAIGGITLHTIPQLHDAGIAGVVVMTPAMKTDRPEAFTKAYREALQQL